MFIHNSLCDYRSFKQSSKKTGLLTTRSLHEIEPSLVRNSRNAKMVNSQLCTSTSTCSIIRQRPFDLWLILRAWPHTPQAFLEISSQGGHVFARERHNKVSPQLMELRARLFSNSAWVFLRPAGIRTKKSCETGPTVYPCPRRLESLTIYRYNYKDSTFSSVI